MFRPDIVVGAGRGAMGENGNSPLDFEKFGKKCYFLSFYWEKRNFTIFGAPLEKF